MQQIIDRAGIAAAERLIRPYIRHTPIIRIDSADLGIAGVEPLVLKLEFLQHTGSFKPRGALNKISNLTPDERARGVITISAGNHAQGVAWAAHEENVDALVVMWQGASELKMASALSFVSRAILSDTSVSRLSETHKNSRSARSQTQSGIAVSCSKRMTSRRPSGIACTLQ